MKVKVDMKQKIATTCKRIRKTAYHRNHRSNWIMKPINN